MMSEGRDNKGLIWLADFELAGITALPASGDSKGETWLAVCEVTEILALVALGVAVESWSSEASALVGLEVSTLAAMI